MAGSKEIRTKIKSVENTRKITKAMEMVAASKMRKAQDRMRASRPYAEKIRNVAAHLSFANSEYKHPFLIKRDVVKNVGLIVMSSDKGLCGGLNTTWWSTWPLASPPSRWTRTSFGSPTAPGWRRARHRRRSRRRWKSACRRPTASTPTIG